MLRAGCEALSPERAELRTAASPAPLWDGRRLGDLRRPLQEQMQLMRVGLCGFGQRLLAPLRREDR
jgi:hypothetical protein